MKHTFFLVEFSVIINGTANVFWNESEQVAVGSGIDHRKEHTIVLNEATDILIKSKITLFMRDTLKVGIHRYEFEFTLPPQLPGSCETICGEVRYEIVADLDIPWRLHESTTKKLNIVRIEDLNLQPDLKLAVRNEEIVTFCCFFCASDPCMVTLKLPFSGYVPGQYIDFEIDFHNKSDIDLIETLVVLQKTIRYESDLPEKNVHCEINDVTKVKVPKVSGKVERLHEGRIQIPREIQLSNSHCCRIIQISYDLKIEVVTVGCHGNISIQTPITIGSIPLEFFKPSVPLYRGKSPISFESNNLNYANSHLLR